MTWGGRLYATALVLAVALPLSPAAADNGEPRASFNQNAYDFGAVQRGQLVRHSFVVRNEGTAPLVIEKAIPTDEAIEVGIPRPIAPGAEGRVTLELATQDVRGAIKAGAEVFTNDPDQPRIRLTLTGRVRWPIDVLPIPAVFLSVFRGQTKEKSVTLVNNGESPIRILRVGQHDSRYEVNVEPIEEGQSFRLTVKAKADAPTGRVQERLDVLTTHPEMPKLTLAINVLIKDEVYANPEGIDFGQIHAAQLRADPTVVALLTQSVFIAARPGRRLEIQVECDISFLRIKREVSREHDRHRLEISPIVEKLSKGPFSGFINVRTDHPAVPALRIPVTGTVE